MEKKQVEIGKKAPLIRRIVSAVLAFLILFYIGYQIWSANYDSLKWETATWATVADSFQTTGYAVRKETVITREDSGGVIGYRLKDGGRVSKNGIVADVFANDGAASAQQQSEQLATEIQLLESLSNPGETYALDIQQIDGRIDQNITELLEAARDCDTDKISQAREQITYQFNQRQIATGVQVDYEARVAELKAQKESLDNQASAVNGQIKSPVAGYFSSTVDGWETVFDYSNILNLTPEDLKKEYEPAQVADNAIGKVTEEFNWYFVFLCDTTTALKLKQAGSVEIAMPFATTDKVPAKVAAVNQPDPVREGAVVLECSTMNSALSNIREETVQVEITSYSGVMVNEKAIHFETVEQKVTDSNGKERTVTHENVKGVYVKIGGQLHFVQIFSDITVNGYAICRTELTEDEQEQLVTDRTIQLYDEIVVEGKDLYDGKVV